MPLVVHCRDAYPELFGVLEPYRKTALRGIFHSFTGTAEDAARLMEYGGFMLGINGVVTFKKSSLPETLLHVRLEGLFWKPILRILRLCPIGESGMRAPI